MTLTLYYIVKHPSLLPIFVSGPYGTEDEALAYRDKLQRRDHFSSYSVFRTENPGFIVKEDK